MFKDKSNISKTTVLKTRGNLTTPCLKCAVLSFLLFKPEDNNLKLSDEKLFFNQRWYMLKYSRPPSPSDRIIT